MGVFLPPPEVSVVFHHNFISQIRAVYRWWIASQTELTPCFESVHVCSPPVVPKYRPDGAISLLHSRLPFPSELLRMKEKDRAV